MDKFLWRVSIILASLRVSRKNIRNYIRKRPVYGTFYVTYISRDGNVREQRLQARHMIEKDGELYIYGWSERLPCFRATPVKTIRSILDEASGEVVLFEDVRSWLAQRSMH